MNQKIPQEDGFYWMRNISGPKSIWRVVQVFKSIERWQPNTRVARDGQSLYDDAYLTTWDGVEFHGPLVPPENKSD